MLLKRLPLPIALTFLLRSITLGEPVLSEIVADNETGLSDEDGEQEDWIELYNPSSVAEDLSGWHLTDDAADRQKWTFPAGTSIPPGSYLVVFASNKDRAIAGATLHTNFKLSSDGEQLTLSKPDGSIASSLTYPALGEDISFGTGFQNLDDLITPTSSSKLVIPTDNTLGDTWKSLSFDDSAWLSGTAAIGYDDGSPDGSGSSPLGYWDFNDATSPTIASDASGNGNPGTITTATYTADQGGHSGQPGDRAMDFGTDGNSATVKIASAADGFLDDTTINDAITISLWTFGGPELPERNIAFAATTNATGGGVVAKSHLPWSNGTIFWDTVDCCDPSESRISKSEPNEANYKGQWNHYLFLKDGTRKEIWQNGTLFASGTNTLSMTPIRGFWIGSSSNGATSFPGLIDDFAIWGTALTPQEITAIAAGASPLAPVGFDDEITSDLLPEMQDVSASAFLRVPFQLTANDQIDRLTLRLKHDDGVVIFLNGTEVARRNAPTDLDPATAVATSNIPKLEALTDELIDISDFSHLLQTGTNVLALHGLNDSPGGSDFLLKATLESAQELPNRFFTTPTPGIQNGPGAEGFAQAPTFSPPRGFFDSPVALTITGETPGASLIYTLDGTRPTSENGTLIEAPGPSSLATTTLNISATTPVRANALKGGLVTSPVTSHTYLFANQVGAQGPNPSGYPDTWGVYGNHGPFVGDPFPADYEMDPEVVNNTQPGHGISEAISSIPSVCISLPAGELFDAAAGIWANSVEHGNEWERNASIEIIYPDASSPDHQVDAGLRINGGLSRQHHHAHKHSFRLNFRREYGAASLDHRLFPDSPVDRYDELVLRASSTDGWAVSNSGLYPRTKATYMRDVWVKDTQLSMSRPGGHSRYVNVFLNGLYFGQYNLAERNDQRWHAEYLGGAKGDYDIIKNALELDSGSKDAWDAMMALAESGLETEAAYQLIQGNNPDGTPNPALPVYLDVDNLIDYMILHIYIGAVDWPIKNWWSARERGENSKGFRFYAWDQEIGAISLTRTETFNDGPFEEVSVAGPAFLYDRLRQNTTFQSRFADRVQELMFNGGILTPEKNRARWLTRQREIDQSIVAESARWGDSRNGTPYLRETDWLAEMDWQANTYWIENHNIALKRFENVNLFPAGSSQAPSLSHSGGRIEADEQLEIVAPSGTTYFTTDGSDPMAPNGSIAASAQIYVSPIPLSDGTTIQTRTLTDTTWSPLREATYYLSQAASSENIAISEIHYQPLEGISEFIELTNFSTNEVDLSGVSFVAGISYTFPQGIRLVPGARIVLTDTDFSGRLDNAGEQLILLAENRTVIADFTYSNNAPWPTAPADSGHSLTLIEPLDFANPSLSTNWRRSLQIGGSPGTSDATFFQGPDPDADLDNDGLNAFAEHALGTSDTVPNLSILTMTKRNGIVTLSYPRRFEADDAQIIIQTSANLQSWINQETIPITSDGTSVTAQIPPARAGEETLFARLIIRQR
ncbi:MAG: lamin tail domain-containing protein [Akkermansiaceae bacterium]